MSSGLAAVLIEAPERFQELASTNPVPQQMIDQCKFWNMATSGNIVGKMSTTDFKGQPWGPFPIVMVSSIHPNYTRSSKLSLLEAEPEGPHGV